MNAVVRCCDVRNRKQRRDPAIKVDSRAHLIMSLSFKGETASSPERRRASFERFAYGVSEEFLNRPFQGPRANRL